MNVDPTRQIARWMANARTVVVFTGAGVSTESGIPDFRSPGGIWSRRKPILFDDYCCSPQAQLDYWEQRVEMHAEFASAEPNGAHRAFARWEQASRIRGVVTQNIDGLHQLAGSQNVVELHGTARKVGCLDCGALYDAETMLRQFRESRIVPRCAKCGGLTKHATISFGQSLAPDVLRTATNWARNSDLFLALGSSLVVTPAADLPVIAKESGARLIIINREPTPLDGIADLIVTAAIGETVEKIDADLLSAQVQEDPFSTKSSRST